MRFLPTSRTLQSGRLGDLDPPRNSSERPSRSRRTTTLDRLMPYSEAILIRKRSDVRRPESRLEQPITPGGTTLHAAPDVPQRSKKPRTKRYSSPNSSLPLVPLFQPTTTFQRLRTLRLALACTRANPRLNDAKLLSTKGFSGFSVATGNPVSGAEGYRFESWRGY